MRTELWRGVPLLLLFVAGLGAGVWIFASPWALGYPTPAGWTASVWTSVWVGGGLAAISGVGLVTLLARSLLVTLREAPAGDGR